ncbi:MAG: hypothetical protein AAFT19_09900, partial [Pseudomonadota bacterium]
MTAAWIAWGPASLVGLPLIGMFVCLALPRRGHAIATATAMLLLALVVVLGLGGGIGGATILGDWAAPLGILLRLDALAWAFMAITAAVFALVTPAAKAALATSGAPALW